MKPKYTIKEYAHWEEAACGCCTDFMVSYEIYSGNELIDGGFLTKEDALVGLLDLYNVEVSFE